MYGYCPTCYGKVISRTRGGANAQDTCENRHTYLSRNTLNNVESQIMSEINELNVRIQKLDAILNKKEENTNG